MGIQKYATEERMTAKKAYKETMRWLTQNQANTLEEAIEHYKKEKERLKKETHYSTQGLKEALTDKTANL